MVRKLNTFYNRYKVFKTRDFLNSKYQSGRLETFVMQKLKELRLLFPNESNSKIIRLIISLFNYDELMVKFCESVSESLELFLSEVKIHDNSVFGPLVQDKNNPHFFEYNLNDYFPARLTDTVNTNQNVRYSNQLNQNRNQVATGNSIFALNTNRRTDQVATGNVNPATGNVNPQ